MRNINSLPHVLITGSSGFIGSKLTDSLSKFGYKVCGIDIRPPSNHMLTFLNSRDISFITQDISNKKQLQTELNHYIDQNGVPNIIIHLATFWNYSNDYSDKFYECNLDMTQNLLDLCTDWKYFGNTIDKFIYASSVEALPYYNNNNNQYQYLEKSLYHPYGWSKANNEVLLTKYFNKFNIIILRLGGVYSDWCELPPITWLFNRWGKDNVLGRIIPGKGQTVLPVIHRDNLMLYFDKFINENYVIFPKYISVHEDDENYAISHNELFALIKTYLDQNPEPIHIPKTIIKLGLLGENILQMKPKEQMWMLNLLDEEIVDKKNIYDSMGINMISSKKIRNSIGTMSNNYLHNKEIWNLKQKERESHQYNYSNDE